MAQATSPSRADRMHPVAVIGLVGVTAVWGVTFLVVKDAVARIPVFDFLFWRFSIAAVLMLIVRSRRVVRRVHRSDLRCGALLGLALGTAYVTQTMGLQHTPAAVSGFLTGLFVVFTPILAWLVLRRRPGKLVWVAVIVATLGLALVTVSGFKLGEGEILTVICAVFFALHIIGLDQWSSGRDAYSLTVIQLGVVGIICGVIFLAQGPSIPRGWNVWMAIAITSVAASALAYMIQTWAQARLTATQTAVILTMEPVFAGFFGIVIGRESLTVTTVVGGALVVAAMYLVELGSAQHQDKPAQPVPAPRTGTEGEAAARSGAPSGGGPQAWGKGN